jgi:hypothetical protein
MNGNGIPRDQWRSFLDQFGLNHEGWIAIVERVGRDVLEPYEASEHALDSVQFELEGDESNLVISLSDETSVSIAQPQSIRLEGVEEQQDELLEIESPTETLRLHLRFPRQTDAKETGEEEGLPSEQSGLTSEGTAVAAEEDLRRRTETELTTEKSPEPTAEEIADELER